MVADQGASLRGVTLPLPRLKKKGDNRLGMLEAVRMVPHTLLADDFDASPEFPISFLHTVGVFRNRNHLIRLPHHMQKGNPGIGQAFQSIEWETFEAGCLFFGESIGLQTSFPSFPRTLSLALTGRPAFEIKNRGIGVDAKGAIGILLGPVVNDQASTTHSF